MRSDFFTMYALAWWAFAIFDVTMLFVIWQPRGLSIGWPAIGGALLGLLVGAVSLHDVWTVTGIVWDATLAFIGIILISVVLDKIGFFEWAALHITRLARGNGRLLFVYIVLLGALVSAFFANDGAALILTPIVLAQMRALRLEDKLVLPFLMASGFIADTTSIPLTTSNLTNIVSSDFFGIGFVEYARHMIVPDLISIGASLLVLVLFFRKSIPHRYDLSHLPEPHTAIRDPKLFRLAWPILGLLLVGYFVSEFWGLPVSLIAGLAAILFLLAARKSPAIQTGKVVREAPWTIVVFSIGMYVVVYGLRNAGLTNLLARVIEHELHAGLLSATVGMGFISAILSAIMNNLPTLMIDALAIKATTATGLMQEALIYANVIGTDLGTKLTPIGSLATLIWLHILSQRGVKITWGYFCRVGIVLTVPTLLITLIGLYGWLRLVG